MSINLRESAQRIVANNPDLAEPLYDALVFMAQPRSALTPEYDETTEMLYAMTEDSRVHRQEYEKKRVAA